MDPVGDPQFLRQRAQARFVRALADQQQPRARQAWQRADHQLLALARDQRADAHQQRLGKRQR